MNRLRCNGMALPLQHFNTTSKLQTGTNISGTMSTNEKKGKLLNIRLLISASRPPSCSQAVPQVSMMSSRAMGAIRFCHQEV